MDTAPVSRPRPQARPSNSTSASRPRPAPNPRASESVTSTRPSRAQTPPLPRPNPISGVDQATLSREARGSESALSPGVQSLLAGFSEPRTDAASSNPILQQAESWVGREFKPGETARCADFVSTVIGDSGVVPENFRHTVRARDFASMGTEVPQSDMQAGDVIGFNNTWRHSPDEKHHTHVGIYAGDGMFIHRPTFDGPVVRESIEEYLSSPRAAEGTPSNLPDRSIGGVYRMTP